MCFGITDTGYKMIMLIWAEKLLPDFELPIYECDPKPITAPILINILNALYKMLCYV